MQLLYADDQPTVTLCVVTLTCFAINLTASVHCQYVTVHSLGHFATHVCRACTQSKRHTAKVDTSRCDYLTV